MAQEPKGYIEGSHFSPDLLEFIRVLHKHRVDYIVVGGEAVIYHGHARFTGDVDFFYSDASENIHRLFEALLDFWEGDIPGVSSPDELKEPGIVIQFGRPPNRIDLMNRIDGVSFQEAWETRLKIQIEADPMVPLPMLSLESLIRNKRATGRPKDTEDLEFLAEKLRDARPGPAIS